MNPARCDAPRLGKSRRRRLQSGVRAQVVAPNKKMSGNLCFSTSEVAKPRTNATAHRRSKPLVADPVEPVRKRSP